MCTQNFLQVCSSYFVLFPLSLSTNMGLSGLFWEMGVAHPWQLSRIPFLRKLLRICRLLHASPAAWLVHPSRLLFVLSFSDLFWVGVASLLVCWLLGWHPPLGVSGRACPEITYGLRVTAGGYGLVLGGALGGCTKLTVGSWGRVPKVGKGRGWGRNKHGKLEEKDIKGAGHM